MKRLSAVIALTMLAGAGVALAQQPTPQTQPQPSASATSQDQSQANPPADSSASSGQADKQAMMKDCMTQIQAANPGVPGQVIKDYCDKQTNKPSPQQ